MGPHLGSRKLRGVQANYSYLRDLLSFLGRCDSSGVIVGHQPKLHALFFREILSKLIIPYICIKFDIPKMGPI